MESTSKCFSFNTLPMEMKEMVLEKVNPADSMKLLKVNKQLRAYILQRGSFFKRFEKIEYKFRGRDLKIAYHFGGENAEIQLRLDEDNNLCFTGFSLNLRLPRSTHAHFQFLGKILPPPKTIEVSVSRWAYWTLDFLHPAINLGDLIPKCRFLYGFAYYWEWFAQFKDFFRIFSSKIMHSFRICYNGMCGAWTKPFSYPRMFTWMLADCKEVVIHLREWASYLFDALLQSNVEKISMYFCQEEMNLFMDSFGTIVDDGIPSRNSQAKIVFQYIMDGEIMDDDIMDDDIMDDEDWLVSTFIERIGREIPSLRMLAAHSEDGIKYQQLFDEISADNGIDDDLDVDHLWIYETSSPKKCLFFVYYSISDRKVYIVSHYV